MAMTFGRSGVTTSDGAVAFQLATSMGKPVLWGIAGQPCPKALGEKSTFFLLIPIRLFHPAHRLAYGAYSCLLPN